jgi:predicted DNA-binding ribbon-helix-helix protein
MAQNEPASIEELSENIDNTVQNLKNLEDLAEKSPESGELTSYLRIAIASLRTAIESCSCLSKRR